METGKYILIKSDDGKCAIYLEPEAKSNSVRLDIPYFSQWDTPSEILGVHVDADARRGDCGPAVLCSIIHAFTDHRPTVDTVADACGQPLASPGNRYTNHAQLIRGAKHYGLKLETRSKYRKPVLALDLVADELRAGRPSIILANYGVLGDGTGDNQDTYRGGHWMLAVGCDRLSFYLHDPDFWGARRNEGAYRRVDDDELGDAIGTVSPGCTVGYQGLVLAQ